MKKKFKSNIARNLCTLTLMVSAVALSANCWLIFGEVKPDDKLLNNNFNF